MTSEKILINQIQWDFLYYFIIRVDVCLVKIGVGSDYSQSNFCGEQNLNSYLLLRNRRRNTLGQPGSRVKVGF